MVLVQAVEKLSSAASIRADLFDGARIILRLAFIPGGRSGNHPIQREAKLGVNRHQRPHGSFRCIGPLLFTAGPGTIVPGQSTCHEGS